MRVVATAGNVDHGKSTLVLALTGTDPDRFAEEKARGLTSDLGFAWTTLPSGRTLAFVDVPGHVRFIKNMLAGVGAVDACLFVVAATEGWKPQSEEHLRILELLGVGHGLIALTKVGLVDDDARQLAALEVSERMAGTFLDHARVVEVDVVASVGVDELRAALDDLLAATPTAGDRDRPRLWVDRVFAAKGSGTVVTGTLTGGSISVGDELALVPGDRRVRVRALQTHQQARQQAAPGSRVAANLTGVHHDEVRRGDALVRADQWAPTKVFDASLEILESLDHAVSRRGAFHAYVGSGEHPAQLRLLGGGSEREARAGSTWRRSTSGSGRPWSASPVSWWRAAACGPKGAPIRSPATRSCAPSRRTRSRHQTPTTSTAPSCASWYAAGWWSNAMAATSLRPLSTRPPGASPTCWRRCPPASPSPR